MKTLNQKCLAITFNLHPGNGVNLPFSRFFGSVVPFSHFCGYVVGVYHSIGYVVGVYRYLSSSAGDGSEEQVISRDKFRAQIIRKALGRWLMSCIFSLWFVALRVLLLLIIHQINK